MSTKLLVRRNDLFPTVFNDFFKPWNEWFDKGWEKTLSVPAVNITENEADFMITVAAPGMKKEDFKIDVDGNMLTISAETEEKKENKEDNYNRREYNYSSFSRTFTLPDEVNEDMIDATYENGLLKIMLPKNEEVKTIAAKSIAVK